MNSHYSSRRTAGNICRNTVAHGFPNRCESPRNRNIW